MSPATERSIADAILDRVADGVQRERLAANRAATGLVEYGERAHREQVEAAFAEYHDLLRGRMAHAAERHQMAQPVHARAPPGYCLSRLDAHALETERRDRAEEQRCRDEGAAALRQSRQTAAVDTQKREDNRRRLREDLVGFRAAAVFLVAEESRQRTMGDKAMWDALAALCARFAAEEALAMKAVAAREATEEAARQDVIAAAKREAGQLDEKRQAEVQRRQQKLIGKCTHARNGTSVFLGAYPKKMCLICRIKLDAISGLYIQMERHEKH